MKHALSIAAALCGLSLIGFGIIKYQNADQLRQEADKYLAQQRDTSKVYQEKLQPLLKRYQAGEIDSVEWHKEIAVIQSQFEKDAEQAGIAWNESLTEANNSQILAYFLVPGGLIAIAASVFYLLSKEPNSTSES